MIDLPIELGDDSEDLTDEQVENAIAVPGAEQMLKHLREMRCCECQEKVSVVRNGHALRRRTPFLYGRMIVRCENNHEKTIAFRLDWLAAMQHGSS